jgi:hypothetical protein
LGLVGLEGPVERSSREALRLAIFRFRAGMIPTLLACSAAGSAASLRFQGHLMKPDGSVCLKPS